MFIAPEAEIECLGQPGRHAQGRREGRRVKEKRKREVRYREGETEVRRGGVEEKYRPSQ
jgi:hypothetical protein